MPKAWKENNRNGKKVTRFTIELEFGDPSCHFDMIEAISKKTGMTKIAIIRSAIEEKFRSLKL